MLHQPEIAVVLRLGRPMRRVGMLGVAPHIGIDAVGRHALEGLVPVDRVVAARFPGVKDRNQPFAVRIAVVVEPAVPGDRPCGSRARARSAASALSLARSNRRLHGEARDRRLGDARGRRSGGWCPRHWVRGNSRRNRRGRRCAGPCRPAIGARTASRSRSRRAPRRSGSARAR